MTDSTHIKANANKNKFVHKYKKEKAKFYMGSLYMSRDGTNSSSDGMRMQLGVHHYIQMQTNITELEKEPPSIDLRVINSLLTTQKLFILIQGMQFMFWMVYYTMRRI
ncbi:hypothetical protein SAMN04487919_12016 [Bacillus sp. ok061]|nr:hypothetical protein SAMN04487919_12016 [Bacillus sp. ok061]